MFSRYSIDSTCMVVLVVDLADETPVMLRRMVDAKKHSHSSIIMAE